MIAYLLLGLVIFSVLLGLTQAVDRFERED